MPEIPHQDSLRLEHRTPQRLQSEVQQRSTPVPTKQLVSNSYINRELFKIPGVGNYKYEGKRRVTEASPVYSLRQKTKVIDKAYSIEPQNSNPSPAAYQNNPESY